MTLREEGECKTIVIPESQPSARVDGTVFVEVLQGDLVPMLVRSADLQQM